MKNVKYVIPSYNRSNIIKTHTLKILEKYNIPKKQIYIFVSDNKQYDDYKNSLGDDYNIIIGKLGLHNQRNFITNYFKEGQHILNMDDDIKKLCILKNGILEELNEKDFKNLLYTAFNFCIEKHSYIWGIHQTQNPRFMRQSITFDLSFLVGFFWGCINRHIPELNLEMEIKEDYQRTIKYWQMDKTIIKFNYIMAETNIYKTIGGLQDTYLNNDRQISSIENSNKLVELYPQYLKLRENQLNTTNKSLYCELRFIKGHISHNNYYIKLPEIDFNDEFIKKIVSYLDNVKLHTNYKRLNTGIGQTQTFGRYKIRRKTGLYESVNNSKYPELYNLLLEFYEKYVKEYYPEYTSIQLNKNYITKPHIDKNNIDNSYIVALGNYSGGDLILNSYKHNIRYKPLLFNGKKWEHSTEAFEGNRYSIVFFNLCK